MTEPSTYSSRPLVLLAHGTANREGQRVLHDVAQHVARQLPDVDTSLGFVDVCEPEAGSVLAARLDAVVVPYLLTSGFHVRSDVPRLIRRTGGSAVLTSALGVSPEVVQALVDRLRQSLIAGNEGQDTLNQPQADAVNAAAKTDAVVLAAAGSSQVEARRQVMCLAALVAASTGLPVRAGFLSGTGPQAADVVQDLRAGGARHVTALPCLLAPGFFLHRVTALGADVSAAALGVHPRLIDAVVDRYRGAS